MPNYVLSRTSPPTHIYERKINLGYGIKVDTSDAPTPDPKERKMEDVKQVVDVVEHVKSATFADGTVLEGYKDQEFNTDTQVWETADESRRNAEAEGKS